MNNGDKEPKTLTRWWFGVGVFAAAAAGMLTFGAVRIINSGPQGPGWALVAVGLTILMIVLVFGVTILRVLKVERGRNNLQAILPDANLVAVLSTRGLRKQLSKLAPSTSKRGVFLVLAIGNGDVSFWEAVDVNPTKIWSTEWSQVREVRTYSYSSGAGRFIGLTLGVGVDELLSFQPQSDKLASYFPASRDRAEEILRQIQVRASL